MYIQRKRIVADEELDVVDVNVDEEPVADVVEDVEEDVVVDPEASELIFEAEDVAELVAEITGEPVEVSVEEDKVVFAVGEEEFTVEPEGDEEILEAVRKPLKTKKPVAAATKRAPKVAPKEAENKRIPRTDKKR